MSQEYWVMSLSGSVAVEVRVTVSLTVGDDGETVNDATGGDGPGGGLPPVVSSSWSAVPPYLLE